MKEDKEPGDITLTTEDVKKIIKEMETWMNNLEIKKTDLDKFIAEDTHA